MPNPVFFQPMQQMGGPVITQAVMTLNDTSPHVLFLAWQQPRVRKAPSVASVMWGLATTTYSLLWDATLMPVTGRILYSFFFFFFEPLLKLFNHLFLPRFPKKTQKQVCVRLRNKFSGIGSQREKVTGVRGERLKVPVVWVVLMEPC